MAHRKATDRDHAFLSASASHRWLECTKAPMLEADFEDTTSIYAEESTLAHELGELKLKNSWRKQNRIKNHELFYEGMVNEVDIYVTYCKETFNEFKAKDPLSQMDIEQRLDYSSYAPEGFGTGDCVIIGDNRVEVIDLKFGKGVEVDPKENTQLMLYGLGALEAYDFLFDIKEVTLTVAQVRLQGISSWTISAKDLREWGESVVKPRALLAYEGKGEAIPGDWCRFCKFKGQCSARAEQLTNVYKQFKEKERETLELEDLAYILDHEKLIQNWLKDVSEYALGLGLAGTKIPGYKVVEGRSNRRISDGEGLATVLIGNGYEAEDVYRPQEIKTITALEKLVGKKDFAELSEAYITKPEGKPTLAKDSDKRKSIVQTPEDEFDFEN